MRLLVWPVLSRTKTVLATVWRLLVPTAKRFTFSSDSSRRRGESEEFMSVSGISGGNSYDITSIESNISKVQSSFEQLGSDLQSGNLSSAKEDYVTLSENTPGGSSSSSSSTSSTSSTSSSSSTDPMSQKMSALGQALNSGDLSGAQKAYSSIQQDFQKGPNASNSSSSSSSAPPGMMGMGMGMGMGMMGMMGMGESLNTSSSGSSTSSTDSSSSTATASTS